MGVDTSVDKLNEVNASQAEIAQVTITSEAVFARFESGLKPSREHRFGLLYREVCTYIGHKFGITLVVGVSIDEVAISPAIHIIPRAVVMYRVTERSYSSIYDRHFPVFLVVNLTESRDNSRKDSSGMRRLFHLFDRDRTDNDFVLVLEQDQGIDRLLFVYRWHVILLLCPNGTAYEEQNKYPDGSLQLSTV